mgnify:CR=1 FL=1
MASENDRWADDAAVHDLARIITDTVGGVLSMAGAFATAQAILNRYQWPTKRPRFPIEASDQFAVETILFYLDCCRRHGADGQAGQVVLALAEIRAWQHDHPGEVHIPDHIHQPWQPRS